MEEENQAEESKLLDSNAFQTIGKVADSIPRKFLNWKGYPAVIGLATAVGTTLDLYRTLTTYFSDSEFFMWAEQGFLARFLVSRTWYLFAAWEWFPSVLTVYLSTRESIIVRVRGFVIAPLGHDSPYVVQRGFPLADWARRVDGHPSSQDARRKGVRRVRRRRR